MIVTIDSSSHRCAAIIMRMFNLYKCPSSCTTWIAKRVLWCRSNNWNHRDCCCIFHPAILSPSRNWPTITNHRTPSRSTSSYFSFQRGSRHATYLLGRRWDCYATVRLGSRCRSVYKTREFRFDYLTHMIDGIENMSFVSWHFLASRILAEISNVKIQYKKAQWSSLKLNRNYLLRAWRKTTVR